MRSLSVAAAVLLVAGAVAGAAQARQGTGLYAPFPSPSGGARAERFAGELGVKVDRAQLERGVPVAVGPAPPSDAAARRAGAASGMPSVLTIALAAGAALLAALGVALVRRRPVP